MTVDSSTGLFVATRLSDGKTIYVQRNLSYAPAMLPGIPPSAQIALDGPAQTETLVGMGEQGLTGRVTLQFPFNRVFQDTEYYPYNQGRQAFFPLYFSSAGYGALFSLPSYGWLNLDHGASNFVVNSSSVRVLDVWITCSPDTPVYAADAPHPFLALFKQVGARSCAVGRASLMRSPVGAVRRCRRIRASDACLCFRFHRIQGSLPQPKVRYKGARSVFSAYQYPRLMLLPAAAVPRLAVSSLTLLMDTSTATFRFPC